MKKTLLFFVLGLAVTAVLAVTETPLNVSPGLWQIDRTMTYGGLPPNMQAQLDRLTPEQRAAMGYGTAHTYKQCVTEKGLHTSWVQGDENCSWTVLKSSGSDLELQGTSCRLGRDEGLTTSLLVKIHVADSEHVRGAVHGTATGNGMNATLDGTYIGKRISAACPR